MSKLRFSLVLTTAASTVAASCTRSPPQPIETPRIEVPPSDNPTGVLVLPAPSTLPRYAVATSDPDEIALLADRLKLRDVRAVGGTLYFSADQGQLARLRQLGYQVTLVDAEGIDVRVVRVRRDRPEESLVATGVVVVTREPGYWIVSGTLAQLRRAAAAGFRLEQLAAGEPRPRWIRVVVTNRTDVQRVANLEVDIFSVADTAGRYTILGAALDMQIDRLRAAGFNVVLLPRP